MTGAVLRSGPLTLHLRPQEGGRIAALHHRDLGDLIVPMTDAPFDPEYWQKAGAYPLIPFHNRVPEGRFDWQGTPVTLPLHPAEPNALHGFTSRRAWSLTTEAGRATMTFAHAGDAAWPWAMRAGQGLDLSPTALTLDLSVTNLSERVMPAGLGWHPFIAATAITQDAALGWPLGPDMLPLGHSTRDPVPGPTRCLSDWRSVGITLASGARLRMTASAGLSHLVIHEGAGYACIEPVSHRAGDMQGLHPLAPGETLRGTVTLALI